MQISPRYDGPPVLDVDFEGDPAGPIVRQRRRLADTLRTLTDEQWASPSRCEGWTVQDVVSHLIGTDGFWIVSFRSGLKGEPTRFLSGFDPVATPAQMVQGMQALTPADVLTQFEEKTDALEELLVNVDASQWAVLAEAPPGHLALRVAALHALWDGWVHERDIVIPLGFAPVERADEMDLVLRYAVGLSPAFFVATESRKTGALTVSATEPALSLLVEVGESVRVRNGAASHGPCLAGRTVDLIEGLSHRGEFAHSLEPDDMWLLDGLSQVFDKV
ncbi:MAG: maleylpyruvate isomerase family mycothiol-dependent enzyme [Actinobacteria bacterium]|nr:maleylpyruvate isomerase family mycothiol-dependent enzyme [Actinomycetota bacterium]